MKQLKDKIDNLRLNLKRPNEILLKYKDLINKYNRDENISNEVEERLLLSRLELSRQKDSWELISTPTIFDKRESPNRKSLLIRTFIISSLFGSFIAYLIDRREGYIYELSQLKEKISCDFIDTLYLQNNDLMNQVVNNFSIKINSKKTAKKCIIDFNRDIFKNNRLIF